MFRINTSHGTKAFKPKLWFKMFQQYIEQVYEIDMEQKKTGTEIKEQKKPGQRKKKFGKTSYRCWA